MNNLERFKAVVNFEKPDYIPIIGLPGAPGLACGEQKTTYDHLVQTGMPADIGGWWDSEGVTGLDGWQRYWGTTSPLELDFFPAEPARGIAYERRSEGDWEVFEYETGAVTIQLIDNDVTYTMPEYRKYHIRDRKSWEFYRDRETPGDLWNSARIDKASGKFTDRDKPLVIDAGSTWGVMRNLMGPELACTILYDDPGLVHEIFEWLQWKRRKYVFPLIERLKPEIVLLSEDMCYNRGMFFSGRLFDEFCAPYYRETAQFTKACGVDVLVVDTDGRVMELVPLMEACGVNAMFPFEVKSDNDLKLLRKNHPGFIMFGGLEKEVINEGNGHLIEDEIIMKVPELLESGGYFPNLDHGFQPMATFENMCRFMTLLHEVTGNPEGNFPRMR